MVLDEQLEAELERRAEIDRLQAHLEDVGGPRRLQERKRRHRTSPEPCGLAQLDHALVLFRSEIRRRRRLTLRCSCPGCWSTDRGIGRHPCRRRRGRSRSPSRWCRRNEQGHGATSERAHLHTVLVIGGRGGRGRPGREGAHASCPLGSGPAAGAPSQRQGRSRLAEGNVTETFGKWAGGPPGGRSGGGTSEEPGETRRRRAPPGSCRTTGEERASNHQGQGSDVRGLITFRLPPVGLRMAAAELPTLPVWGHAAASVHQATSRRRPLLISTDRACSPSPRDGRTPSGEQLLPLQEELFTHAGRPSQSTSSSWRQQPR